MIIKQEGNLVTVTGGKIYFSRMQTIGHIIIDMPKESDELLRVIDNFITMDKSLFEMFARLREPAERENHDSDEEIED